MRNAFSIRAALLVGLLTALPAAGAGAQTFVVHRVDPASAKGYGDVRISRATVAGQQVRIWWATLLNPDCTAAGTMTTEVTEQPRHGQVSLSDELFYPNYQEPNPRTVCDRQETPGKQAFYTAEAGFHGHDKVVLQNATSEGRVRRIVVDIEVR